ncbi:YIP1 family protein [Halomicroarcula sp. F28]|uniref:YIP1 family protein n=1 Tax=Haloarcula salinisoli TaxID=2487746 RepID=UPI001C735D17|nr:YIP1 family protein [Halomicroarcula salinisoli]MBX0285075.1 YIP1 family protein [Halomicroarcula salinisoli]
MTQWVETTGTGRDRGPVAIVRAWAEVLRRPRRFFRTGIAPGDQAPGLIFASLVVLVEELGRFLVVELASRGVISTGPFPYPAIGDFTPGVAVLALLGIIVFVAPITVHLTAAIQTLLLVPTAPDRGGISETVQVMCYAMAPCIVAGLPFPELRVVVTLWGAVLYVVGTAVVHELSLPKAVAVGTLPAAIIFGYGFRGFDALTALGILPGIST